MSLRETNRMELEDRCWQVLDDETMEGLLKSIEASGEVKSPNECKPVWNGKN